VDGLFNLSNFLNRFFQTAIKINEREERERERNRKGEMLFETVLAYIFLSNSLELFLFDMII